MAEPESGVPGEARRLLVVVIPAAIALWFAIHALWPAPAIMPPVLDRLGEALAWVCVAALFCLGAGIEAVAHERLQSTAFDPLAGRDTHRLQINQRYLQNTVEQFALFAPGLMGLAYLADSGAEMRAVPATALLWIVCRYAFWIGYHRGSAYRVAGVPGLIIPPLLLLYDVARFGHEQAGIVGAVLPVVLYLAVEIALFRLTRRQAP